MAHPLADYFNAIARGLAAEYERTKASSSHRGDRGENREEMLRVVLERHLPRRAKARLGGQIIGLGQPESKQLDIVVSSDVAPIFEMDARSITLTEAVIAAIGVKSHLDKDQILDSLENLASIPQITPEAISVSAPNGKGLEDYEQDAPSLHVFAYEGVALPTALGHVKEYYSGHPEIPVNRYPSTIAVLGKWVIYCRRQDTEHAKAHEFYGFETGDGDIGAPISSMIVSISGVVRWLSCLYVEIAKYTNVAWAEVC